MDQQNQAPVPNQTPSSTPATGGSMMAIFAYLGILIIIPFLTGSKDDPFVKFHIKQGLVLIISFVIGTVVSIVPILGWLVGFVLFLFNAVMVILGIINVVSNKQSQLPLIGKFADKFNF